MRDPNFISIPKNLFWFVWGVLLGAMTTTAIVLGAVGFNHAAGWVAFPTIAAWAVTALLSIDW